MSGKDDKEFFTISVVSKMFEIHPQTLRLYEREGLLAPHRSGGNTRLYARDDLERIRKILSLTRELGINLAGVEVIFDIQEKMEEMKQFIAEMLSYLDHEIKKEFEDRLKEENHALVKMPASNLSKVELKR